MPGFRIRGGFPATVAVLGAVLALPVAAQPPRHVFEAAEAYPVPTDQDRLASAAAAINDQRTEFFRRKDAAGIASMYTMNATYIELLPKLQMMSGRAGIQRHFQELFDARTTDLVSRVTSAQMLDKDTQLVGGDYFLVAGGRRIAGHFVQTLQRQDGVWKIASHIFARPEPVTVGEVEQYRG